MTIAVHWAYLQRHGESETNVSRTVTCRRLDPGLTDTGRDQIQAIVPYYRERDIRLIYSSPSRRAQESATLLSEALGVTVVTDDQLMEVDLGSLEGQSERDPDAMAVFLSTVNDWIYHAREARFPGGESLQEVLLRLRHLESLLSGEGVIVVGHSTLFAIFLGTRLPERLDLKALFLPRGGCAPLTRQTEGWRLEPGPQLRSVRG